MSSSQADLIEEQRQHIQELKRDLDAEKRKIKDVQQNKVLEVKRARDEERARWQVEKEDIRKKAWNQAKTEYMKTIENQRKEHEADILSLTKNHDNNMKHARAAWLQERDHLEKQLELEKEKMLSELDERHRHDTNLLKQELFAASRNHKEAEDRLASLKEEQGRLLEDMRVMRKQHQNEIDAVTKQSKTDSRKEFAEQRELQQLLQSKDKELADMTLRCSQLESKCEQMEAEVLLNRSSRGSLPSTPRKYDTEQVLGDEQEHHRKRTEKEEQLLIRNSELALLNKNLRDDFDRLSKEHVQVKKELTDALKEVEPLRKKNSDHLHRIQELRTVVVDKDRQLQKVMEEKKEINADLNRIEKQFAAERDKSRVIDRRTTEQLKLKQQLQAKDDKIQQLEERIKSLQIGKKLLEDEKDRAKKERAEARLAQVSPLKVDSSIASRRVQERKRVQVMEQDLELRAGKVIELKRQNARLSQRVEDLNASLKRRDTQAYKMSIENNSLKSANQSLEEQVKLYQQQFSDELSQARTEVDRANAKVNKLQCKNSDLKEQIRRMTPSPPPLLSSGALAQSPPLPPFSGEARESHSVQVHLSPVSSLPADHTHSLQMSASYCEDEFGSQWSLASTAESMSRQHIEQLEYDKDELDIKYKEMKSEYQKISGNYMQVRKQYKALLAKSRTTSAKFAQVHKEHLQLQKEMARLRQEGDRLGDFDVKREASLRDQLSASSKRLTKVEEVLTQYCKELNSLRQHQGATGGVIDQTEDLLQEGGEEPPDGDRQLEVDAIKRKEVVGLQQRDKRQLDKDRLPEDDTNRKRETVGLQQGDEELPDGDSLLEDYASKRGEEASLRDQLSATNKRVTEAEQSLLQQMEELKTLKQKLEFTGRDQQDGDGLSQEDRTISKDQLLAVNKRLAEMEGLFAQQSEELGLLKKQKEEAEQAKGELEQSLVETERDLEGEKATSLALKEELNRLQMELMEEQQRRAAFNVPHSFSPTAPSLSPTVPPLSPTVPPLSPTTHSLSPTLQPKLADHLVSALSMTAELERVLGTSQGSVPSRTAALIKQLQMVIGEAQDILSGKSSLRQISIGTDELDAGEVTDAPLGSVHAAAIGRTLMGDRFQHWLTRLQSENQNLKSQVRELEARLAEGSQNVLQLQSLIGELEGRLTAEQSLQSSMLSDHDEQLSLSQQISRLQQHQLIQLPVPSPLTHPIVSSPLARPTVPSPFTINPVLGQRLQRAFKQVQQTAQDSNAKQILQKLAVLENTIQELLQAVYQGRVNFSPTSAELAPASATSETPISPLSTTMDSSIQCTPPRLVLPDRSPSLSPSHANSVSHPFSSPSSLPSPPFQSAAQWTSAANTASASNRLPKQPLPSSEVGLSSHMTTPLPPSTSGREKLFMVLFDYDPQSLCSSGHPERELSVRMGSVIAVHGEMDVNGYYMASFEGNTGLVPAHFIQEMKLDDKKAHQRLINQNLTQSSSPSLVDSEVEISLPYEGQKSFPSTLLMQSITSLSADSTVKGLHHPAPPTNLRVIRSVGSSALLLGWDQPEMDLHGQSHGLTVSGYQLFVDGIAREKMKQLDSKVVVSNVDTSQPHTLSICTLSEEGSSSQVVTIHHPNHQAVLRHPRITRIQQTSSPRSSADSDVLNTKLMVAIYDYNPFIDSPNHTPSLELMFKKGQVITVFGDMKDDGFYCGEVEGRFGLVPSNFVQEIGMEANTSSSSPLALMATPPSPEHDYKRRLFSSEGAVWTSTPTD